MLRMIHLFSACLFASCLFAFGTLHAQTGTLSGTVTDRSTGEELPGVNIFIDELQIGASTDLDGNFTIEDIPYGDYRVTVTFVGYSTQRRSVTIDSATKTRDFRLREDVLGLEDVIVTGQGSGVERQRLSTNVTAISAQQLERLPNARLDELLQANVPNSQIRLTSGSPGTASLVRGRGVVSAIGSTTPVVYVDGIRVDNTSGFALNRDTGGAESSAIADIPVENIERIEYVSGGAATTQFGSDAANGVIQIFTRQGVEGRSEFRLQSTMGVATATTDYMRFDRSSDILFESGLVQEYRLSGSGGAQGITYSFSGSMRGDEGVVVGNGDKQVRHNLRATVGADVTDWARYTGSIGFTNSEYNRNINANFAGSIFDIEAGSFGNPDAWDSDEFAANRDFIQNYIKLHDISEHVRRFQTSHSMDFTVNDNLRARALVGVDYRASGQEFAETNAYLIARGFAPEGTTDQGSLTQVDRDYLGLTVEASAMHEYQVDDFSFITNVGAQIFRVDDQQLRIDVDGIPDGSTNAGSGTETSSSNFEETVVNYGFYLLENIGFRDRYFVEFGLRGDQNTAFGEEVGTQWYPKVGANYNLSSEPFFYENVSPDIISTVRLRGSYGFSGNFPPAFSNEVLASVNPYLGAQSIDFGVPGDIELKPERTSTLEVGADVSFNNDNINLEFTYFSSRTEDALFSAPFARSVGQATTLQNIGVIENSGIEIAGNFNIINTADTRINLRASFNTLTNEVVDNGGAAPFSVGGFAFLGSFVDEGKPVGYFRGAQAVTDDDGNIIDVLPNQDLGSPLPDYFGNIGINADYRSFSLTVTADWQVGAQGINVDEVLRDGAGLGDGRIPAGSEGDFFNTASFFVEDTDFLKVRLISLNYTVPQRLYAGTLNSVTVGFSALNPFNFVSSDFDPEISGAGISAGDQDGLGVGGFGYGTLSPNRQFLGTVSVNF